MDRNQPSRMPCPVCDDPEAVWMPPLDDYRDVDCPSCGDVHLTGSAETLLNHKKALPGFDKKALSERLRGQPRPEGATRLRVDRDLIVALADGNG